MRVLGRSIAAALSAIGLAAIGSAGGAQAQLRLPPARAPCSVLNGHPCHPSFCSVFHSGPCFPEYLPPLGEDLRLTVVSTDDNEPTDKASADEGAGGAATAAAANGNAVDTIKAMFDVLRACWVPPPKNNARHGMQYTVRFAFRRDGELIAPPRRTYSSHDAPAAVRDVYGEAVEAALKRCTPVHFSKQMGGAIAGRPIAVRFVDDRTIGDSKKQQ